MSSTARSPTIRDTQTTRVRGEGIAPHFGCLPLPPELPVKNEESESSPEVSRRDFLVRAGQFGALTAISPVVGRGILSMRGGPSRFAQGLAKQEPTNLYAGLHWRMLG